jgi:aminodeoxychorismate synthase, component I, bacterial clade
MAALATINNSRQERMRSIKIIPDVFVSRLLASSRETGLCILDSCGTEHARSHILIAGIFPSETIEFSHPDPAEVLRHIDQIVAENKAAVFTLSYDFGRKLQWDGTSSSARDSSEPDIFISIFDTLLLHDYSSGETTLAGSSKRFDPIIELVSNGEGTFDRRDEIVPEVGSNFTCHEYLSAIENIKEKIRCGDTYQTNLTQQLSVSLPNNFSAGSCFQRIRREHPAPFAAFLERKDSTVISASPERFFRVEGRRIFASPIKGTRPRGHDHAQDDRLRKELVQSEKDRAENTMIVDLLRNDLGRICEYGSVEVRDLCTLQELPTLFHLVSTIEGRLKPRTSLSQIIQALFPCGSITGAPKRRTMQIIDEIENVPRGLSMGAIGVHIPHGFGIPPALDLSVAIRTMVVRNGKATFNVGGGIVIDSEPEKEYEESLIKARALLYSLGVTGVVTGIK